MEVSIYRKMVLVLLQLNYQIQMELEELMITILFIVEILVHKMLTMLTLQVQLIL